MEIIKEREVRVGDVLSHLAGTFLTPGTVTRVTAEYIWLEHILPSTGEHLNVKRRRDIVLLGTKYC